jgi:hypothetical protein
LSQDSVSSAGDLVCSRSAANTAKLLVENPTLMRLRRNIQCIDTSVHFQMPMHRRVYTWHGFQPLDEERLACLVTQTSFLKNPARFQNDRKCQSK